MAGSIEEQQGARLPGARRMASRKKAQTEGLQISDSLLAEIKAL
jgi:(2R)-3-sulfolactate dehydrogenase (NADP+)